MPMLSVRMSNALRVLDDIIPHGHHFYGSVPLFEGLLTSNQGIRGYLSARLVIYICPHTQNANKQCLQELVVNLPLISQIKHSVTCSYILPVSSGKLKLIICVYLWCVYDSQRWPAEVRNQVSAASSSCSYPSLRSADVLRMMMEPCLRERRINGDVGLDEEQNNLNSCK